MAPVSAGVAPRVCTRRPRCACATSRAAPPSPRRPPDPRPTPGLSRKRQPDRASQLCAQHPRRAAGAAAKRRRTYSPSSPCGAPFVMLRPRSRGVVRADDVTLHIVCQGGPYMYHLRNHVPSRPACSPPQPDPPSRTSTFRTLSFGGTHRHVPPPQPRPQPSNLFSAPAPPSPSDNFRWWYMVKLWKKFFYI
jgi:hypothetical protein